MAAVTGSSIQDHMNQIASTTDLSTQDAANDLNSSVGLSIADALAGAWTLVGSSIQDLAVQQLLVLNGARDVEGYSAQDALRGIIEET